MLIQQARAERAADLVTALTYAAPAVEIVDARGVARLLSVADAAPNVVDRRAPAGQHFGIGGAWARAGTPRAGKAFARFDKAAVCGAGGPCAVTSVADADAHFSVGPVYVAHVDDWREIAAGWWRAMPRVHAQYPHLLAEMYALTMAAANVSTPWFLAASYMVSDPRTQSPTEAWAWVDDLPAARVCAGADATTPPRLGDAAVPVFLHFCQRYELAGVLFAKRRVAHDLFTCDGPPLPFDGDAIRADLGADPPPLKKRTAFMLCHLIPRINGFLAAYQRDACAAGAAT